MEVGKSVNLHSDVKTKYQNIRILTDKASSMATGWNRKVWIFSIGNIVTTFGLFAIALMLYKINAREIQTLKDSYMEMRFFFESCKRDSSVDNKIRTKRSVLPSLPFAGMSDSTDMYRIEREKLVMTQIRILMRAIHEIEFEIESNKNHLLELKSQLNILKDENNQTKSKLDTLEFYNKNVNTSIQQASTKLENIQADLGSVKKNLTEMGETDCGGIISIPTTKTSYFLQYKLGRSYASNENCLWIVENTEKTIRNRLTARVELISHGFKENTTGVFAFKWNREDGLASEEITSAKEIELSAEGLYLSFTSDNDTSTEGTGFLLKITITNLDPKPYGSNWYFRTSSGSHTVSRYQNGDQISIAVNPNRPILFSVNQINSEKNNDYLNVFEIHGQGTFTARERLSGKIKNPISFHTTDPVLSIFTSDFSTTETGFKISWDLDSTMI